MLERHSEVKMSNSNSDDRGVVTDGGGDAADMSDRFDEEWFWVFGSGIAAVIVVAANLLLLVSVCRNQTCKVKGWIGLAQTCITPPTWWE